MKKSGYMLFLIFLLVEKAVACSCGTTRSFCESYTHYDLSASFIVIDTFAYGASLKITHLLNGTENRDTINLWAHGGPYDMCNDSVNENLGFRIGDTIILALDKIDSSTASWQEEGDYVIPGFDCYTWGLSVNNGLVQGLVAGHEYCYYANNCVYSRDYDDFIANLSSCGSWTGINDIWISSKIAVFPNPTTQTISINCGQYRVKKIQVFDVSGRAQNALFEEQNNVLSAKIKELSSGIYFLQILFENGDVATKKIVKESF